MGVDAISPVTGAAVAAAADASSAPAIVAPAADAQSLISITLGQMIADRANVGTASASPVGGIASGQAASIVRSSVEGFSGGGGSLHVPAELQAYGNGRIPKDRLELLGIGQHRLWKPAADAFKSMRAAAASSGVDLGITDSYRTYDQQVELAARKGLYADGGYAAVPGTSPHGWGLAVDVDVSPAGLAWLRANGATYGFVEAVPREPWHWEFHGAT